MISIDDYINNLPSLLQERFLLVTNYIRKHFPSASETSQFSSKCNFPVWVNEATNMYVGMASMKHYMSIYFSKRECIKIVLEKNPNIKCGVACINIKDNDTFPITSIKKAIDFCFKN